MFYTMIYEHSILSINEDDISLMGAVLKEVFIYLRSNRETLHIMFNSEQEAMRFCEDLQKNKKIDLSKYKIADMKGFDNLKLKRRRK